MTTGGPRIVVVVVAFGDDVSEVVRRWRWLDGCVIFDPSERLGAHAADATHIPIVSRLDRLEPGVADWLLVVGGDEVMHPGSAAVVRDAVRTALGGQVFAFPVVTTGLGLSVAARRPVIRLAPVGTTLTLERGLELAFRARGHPVDVLPVLITRERGGTLTAAMQWIGSSAATLAALAEQPHVGARCFVWHAVVAATRVLASASRAGRLGLGRFVLAVLDGYRIVVVHAKLWERRRERILDLG